METFLEWVENELSSRGWRPVDLAKEAGLTQGTLSRVLTGTRGAGPEVCNAIATAFGVDPVMVFRKAGLLPPAPDPEAEPGFWELLPIMKQLTPEQREDVIAYAVWRRSQKRDDGS